VLHWTGNNQDSLLNNNTVGIENFITGANLEITPHQNGYFVTFEVAEFSEFWIGDRTFSPLSIQLLDFTAQKVSENIVRLDWKLSLYKDLQHFEIERASENTHHLFEIIGKYDYQPNKENYTWYDNIPNNFSKQVYYRLKIHENSTTHTYSIVRTVKFNKYDTDSNVVIYPNPAYSMVHIQTNTHQKLSIKIISLLGDIIYQDVIEKDTDLDVSLLKNGIYLLQLTDIEISRKQTRKLVIQRN